MAAARHFGSIGPGASALGLALALWLSLAAGAVAQDLPAPTAPADAGAVAGAVLPPPAAAADDGVIGLIEAPEGAPGLPAAQMPHLPDESQAAAPVATFAEAQPRQRMLGPIDHPPVVVELFTSQGCSSCPPADEMLADLATRDDVLALSWHVDYWDYLGWADPFARPQFTRRQQAYTHAWGERAIYTPQMVVGGTDTLIGLRPAELMTLLQAHMAQPPRVTVSSSPQDRGYRIELTPQAEIANRVAIILVRYAPSRRSEILAGENRGLTLEYRNVVLAAERIAEWDGRAPLRMTVSPGVGAGDAFPADTRHAIIAQELGARDRRASGPILAAIRLD
ncbi:DUF1223 domain-containing protein [Paracoccus sp. (in: a-proteobacteria)]|uniref:DUF1223 domain-containing protein n=1 Tax=Paracoccus sp. TaxID=267 RepID=UPI003220639E